MTPRYLIKSLYSNVRVLAHIHVNVHIPVSVFVHVHVHVYFSGTLTQTWT